jgi:hypothetical protein
LVHGKPISGNLTVQVLVADGGLLQLRSQGFGAPVGHEVRHRLVDEPAALAGLGHAVNGLDRGFRQNNVDAFAHGNKLMIFSYMIYTISVYVKSYQ